MHGDRSVQGWRDDRGVVEEGWGNREVGSTRQEFQGVFSIDSDCDVYTPIDSPIQTISLHL